VRVTLVHNEYARLSGEDVMIRSIARTLSDYGHEVSLFLRSSSEIDRTPFGRVRAFFSGIHSFSAVRSLERHLVHEKPDVVDIQNVYPLISAGAFEAAGHLGIPVVFRCANYRLFCPNGLMLSGGRVCERWAGGREYWCTLKNCEGTLAKSLGYSLRNGWTRLSGAVRRNVTLYAVPSEFQKAKFCAWGVPEDRVWVAPNLVESDTQPVDDPSQGSYIGYAGRVSPEKGLDTLVQAMRRLLTLPCRIAGDYRRQPELAASAPANVRFLGPIRRQHMSSFHAGARMLVVPSVCYESFGLVIAEAMLQGRPVIGSRIGAIPEIIDDGVNGLLFEPGNTDELAEKIRYLWDRPDLCRQMGMNGRQKALSLYSSEAFHRNLITMYGRAIAMAAASREVAA
jgi:glycosyltransferase involved in cell wall biosynthesis